MAGDTGSETETSQSVTVNLDLTRIDWEGKDLGAAVVSKILGHPELTSQEYVSFLLANAYYYSDALEKGAIERDIRIANKNYITDPPVPFSIRKEDITPFPIEHTMQLKVPAYVISLIEKTYENVEEAISEMQEMMDINAPTFLKKHGPLVSLWFDEENLRIFPFVRSRGFDRGFSPSELHPNLQ